jgi:hypothetical protein
MILVSTSLLSIINKLFAVSAGSVKSLLLSCKGNQLTIGHNDLLILTKWCVIFYERSMLSITGIASYLNGSETQQKFF